MPLSQTADGNDETARKMGRRSSGAVSICAMCVSIRNQRSAASPARVERTGPPTAARQRQLAMRIDQRNADERDGRSVRSAGVRDQTAALKSWMERVGGCFPESGLGVDERLNLESREIESLLLESGEGLGWRGHE